MRKRANFYVDLNHTSGSDSEKGDLTMVSEGRGRLFRRTDDKYLIYVPLKLAEDSMFPFKTDSSMKLKISFKTGDNKVIVEKWTEASEE
jgi:hypothetical protein